MSAKIERLRHFVGLQNCNLLRIVAQAAEILKTKMGANRNMNFDTIHAWLMENIKWGALQCPDVNTVKRHVKNWSAKVPRAVEKGFELQAVVTERGTTAGFGEKVRLGCSCSRRLVGWAKQENNDEALSDLMNLLTWHMTS